MKQKKTPKTRRYGDEVVFLPVLRSMVTATAYQILVSNNAPIKAISDNAIVTLEVRGVGGGVILQVPEFFRLCVTAGLYFRGCFLPRQKMHPPLSSPLTMTPLVWPR